MGYRIRAGGYVIVSWDSDHRPLHVHVYKDGRCVGRFDLEHQVFMDIDRRHRGRVLRALNKAGLAKGGEGR